MQFSEIAIELVTQWSLVGNPYRQDLATLPRLGSVVRTADLGLDHLGGDGLRRQQHDQVVGPLDTTLDFCRPVHADAHFHVDENFAACGAQSLDQVGGKLGVHSRAPAVLLIRPDEV